MSCTRRLGRVAWALLTATGAALLMGWQPGAAAQERAAPPSPVWTPSGTPVGYTSPTPAACDKPLPINLPTALRLAGVRPIDIAIASARIRVAAAQLGRAEVLWLPTIYLGADYFRHDGPIQDIAGNVVAASKQSLLLGYGPNAVFAITDAIFGPLAARQVVRARESTLQAARNDSLLAVAEAYFNVEQAVGELTGAVVVAQEAEDLVRQVAKLVPGGLTASVEVLRARAEAARRRQLVQSARERWRSASAELARVLRLDPSVLVQPLEPPHLRVTLLRPDVVGEDLIPVALSNRPELATQQALIQATLQQLRQERLRPLIPSVLVRGAATGVVGTLAGGAFAGGRNDALGHFGSRSDYDVQLFWEWQNLGFGNRARVNERRAENRLTVLEFLRTKDQIAAEVVQAVAQLKSAAGRLADAEAELKDANETAKQMIEGVTQTKRVGNLNILVIRPQEATAAVQSLGQAYNDYYGAVADSNRAQFRLYRALGHPAQDLTVPEAACAKPSPDCSHPAPAPAVRQSPDPTGQEDDGSVILYRGH